MSEDRIEARLVHGWLCRITECAAHVMPMNDLRPHVASPECWCAPAEDEEDESIYRHHALDRREAYERGELGLQ